MAAAEYGHLDIVKLLLNQGANFYDKNNAGKFLIIYFCVETICFLLLMKIYLQNKKENLFFNAYQILYLQHL